MAGLRYVGPDVTTDPEVVYQDYVTGIKAADMSSADIDAAIDAGLNSYATRTYVDTQDGFLATQSYIDAQDALRVPLSAKDANNGVAALGADGRVAQGRINVPNTQRYVRGPWTPAAYNSSPISGTVDQTIYPCTVTDPGFAYKLVVFGVVDTHGYANETPIVMVRADDATSGPIVAYGAGASDSMEFALLGDDFERANGNLGSGWEEVYWDGNGTIGGGSGQVVISGGKAVWQLGDANQRSFRGRNLGVGSKYSASDYQAITAQIGDYAGESWDAGFGFLSFQYLRIYARVNDAFTSYVGMEQRFNDMRWFYANPNTTGSEVYLTAEGAQPGGLTPNQPVSIRMGTPDNPRRFQYLKNGVVVSTFVDGSALTALGPNNRGWGFGVLASNRLNQRQTIPPELRGIFMSDNLENYIPVQISPYPTYLSTGTVRTGNTTLYVRLSRLGSGSVAASTYRPKLHVMCIPA